MGVKPIQRAGGPRRVRARAGPARRPTPWGQPELIVASMALADAVYDAHSRRLRLVLGLAAMLLVASAGLIAALDPGVGPVRGWMHPLCPVGAAMSFIDIE